MPGVLQRDGDGYIDTVEFSNRLKLAKKDRRAIAARDGKAKAEVERAEAKESRRLGAERELLSTLRQTIVTESKTETEVFIKGLESGDRRYLVDLETGLVFQIEPEIDEDESEVGHWDAAQKLVVFAGAAAPEVEAAVEDDPDPGKMPNGDASKPARKVSGVSRHLDGIHVDHGEREQREQASVLRQIQQAMHAKRSIHGHSIKNSREPFKSIDRDHSGMVDVAEFTDALHQLGLGLTPQQVEALVKRLDRDGNGEIDYDELLEYLHGDLTNLAPHLGEFDERDFEYPDDESVAVPAPTQQKLPGAQMLDAAIASLKMKLRALSYGHEGQDPKRLFGQFDRDKSGAMEFSEFKSAVRKGGKLGPRTISDAELQSLFDAVDADGSGDVTIDELTAFVWPDAPAPKVSPKPAGVKPIQLEPKQMSDADTASLRMKLRALSYGTTGQDPKKLFAQFDRDKSGALEYGEFKSAVRKGGKLNPKTISDEELQSLFSAVDADGSGDVTIDELTAFVWPDADAVRKPLLLLSFVCTCRRLIGLYLIAGTEGVAQSRWCQGQAAAVDCDCREPGQLGRHAV